MAAVWALLFAVALSAELSVTRGNNVCPPEESIPGCSCVIRNKASEVICDSLGSDRDLHNVLKALRSYTLQSLTISTFKASTFPVDTFKGLHIKELILEKFEVGDPSFRRGQRHFQGLENSLVLLEIRESFRDRPLLNLQLDHLTKLEVVVLEDNEIPEVGNDWFTNGPKSLHTLFFEHDGIEELGDKAFSSLKNLKLLVFTGNHITALSRSMLPTYAPRLTYLDLAKNKLNGLPSDFFSSMPSLSNVMLEHNMIRTLSPDTWSGIWSQLIEVNLEGNPLHCDKDSSWMCTGRTKLTGTCLSPAENKGQHLKNFCSKFRV